MHDWVSPSMKGWREKKGLRKVQNFVIFSELLKFISKLCHTFWIVNEDKSYTEVLHSEPQIHYVSKTLQITFDIKRNTASNKKQEL